MSGLFGSLALPAQPRLDSHGRRGCAGCCESRGARPAKRSAAMQTLLAVAAFLFCGLDAGCRLTVWYWACSGVARDPLHCLSQKMRLNDGYASEGASRGDASRKGDPLRRLWYLQIRWRVVSHFIGISLLPALTSGNWRPRDTANWPLTKTHSMPSGACVGSA